MRRVWVDAQRPRLIVGPSKAPAGGGAEPEGPFRCAVATMTKRPANFVTWLEWHSSHLQAVHFFLRVEDSPAHVNFLQHTPPWKDCCTVWATNEEAQRDWISQSDRQAQHVMRAIAAARKMGVTHLLAIDDDELLFLPNGLSSLVAAIHGAPNGSELCEFHALTLEALAPSITCANPFAECCAFRHVAADYCSYGQGELSHGKSIGVLAHGALAPLNPHHFRGASSSDHDPAATFLLRTLVLPPSVAVILHYESCSYRRWRDKFLGYASRMRQEGGRNEPGVRQAASFSKFYKQSVEACMHLLQAEATEKATAGMATGPGQRGPPATCRTPAEKHAQAVWMEAKLEPDTVTAARPIEYIRTLGRLTLIPPVADAVAKTSAVASAERTLEQVM